MSKIFIVLISLVMIVSTVIGCQNQNNNLEKEFQSTIENYISIRNEIRITLNEDGLSNIASGDILKNNLTFIEVAKNNASRIPASRESKIAWTEIIASGSSWAVVEVKEEYRSFEIDLQTGAKTYEDRKKPYWSVQKYLLIKEGGEWKVDKILESVSWSG